MRSADRASVHPDPRWTCIVSALQPALVLVLVTAFTARAQTAAPLLQPDEQSRTVRGTVINAVSGAPIPRALVFTPDNRFAMLTDGEGHFEFDLPKPDSANGPEVQPSTFSSTTLFARKPGFLDDPNGRSQTEATPGAEVDIPLLPEALIKGRVIFAEADPAPGATVQLFSRQVQDGMPRWLPAGSARANSNGEFRFAELRPGSYRLGTDELPDNDPAIRVIGQEFGFPPVYYPGVSDFAAAGTIQLAAGEPVQADVPLTRQSYYPVKIPVVNGETVNLRSDGHCLAGRTSRAPVIHSATTVKSKGLKVRCLAEITWWKRSPRDSLRFPARSILRWRARQPKVPAWCSLQAVRSLCTLWNNSLQTTGPARDFAIVAGGPCPSAAPGCICRFSRNRWTISIAGVQHFVRRSGSGDDALVLENLAPGRYWLRLHSARGYVASATMGGVDLLHEPLTVSAGSSTPIEITMRDDDAEIEGKIAGIGATADNVARPGGLAPSAFVYCIPTPDSPGQFLELFGIFRWKDKLQVGGARHLSCPRLQNSTTESSLSRC